MKEYFGRVIDNLVIVMCALLFLLAFLTIICVSVFVVEMYGLYGVVAITIAAILGASLIK